jgi:serine/tyrosine/threonine adenylyltransferase
LLRPEFADLEGLSQPWRAASLPDPQLVVLNEPLAVELGLDVDALRSPDGVAALVGQGLPEGSTTLAQAYAGHQFGGFSSSLGDGRALLLGELVGRDGARRDLHLKGSGATPFARGDGRAALGPMLREHLVGEAMHALGIPTTRALAVVSTGEPVRREVLLPGAVLCRVASSHLRVGTFQYAAVHGDVALVRQLADHAVARHHPAAADAEQPYVALFQAVLEAQAALVARWMLVGFVHGVMNTDNTTISGETIDYGPCAFIDAYDPATVFSSIDHGGRYAFGNQPRIAHWNLARLGEAMLPLFADELEPAVEAANGVLLTFSDRHDHHWLGGVRAKLGLATPDPGDGDLARELLELMRAAHVDFSSCFRALSSAVAGDDAPRRLFAEPAAFDAWAARWRARLAADGRPTADVVAAMDRTNPLHIPRNHLVEEALAAATAGELAPYERLLHVVTHPFDTLPGAQRYAEPAPPSAEPYRTFCGT